MSPASPGGADDRLLPWRRVEDMTGISRSTAWRLQQVGAFPAPIPISPGRVAWWESELSAWKAARARGEGVTRPAAPPRRRPAADPDRRPAEPRSIPGCGPGTAQDWKPQLLQPPPRRSRRVRVSPDQIDFGF